MRYTGLAIRYHLTNDNDRDSLNPVTMAWCFSFSTFVAFIISVIRMTTLTLIYRSKDSLLVLNFFNSPDQHKLFCVCCNEILFTEFREI